MTSVQIYCHFKNITGITTTTTKTTTMQVILHSVRSMEGRVYMDLITTSQRQISYFQKTLGSSTLKQSKKNKKTMKNHTKNVIFMFDTSLLLSHNPNHFPLHVQPLPYIIYIRNTHTYKKKRVHRKKRTNKKQKKNKDLHRNRIEKGERKRFQQTKRDEKRKTLQKKKKKKKDVQRRKK